MRMCTDPNHDQTKCSALVGNGRAATSLNSPSERQPPRRLRHGVAHVAGGFEPGRYGILHVEQRFLGGFAVAHAAGEIGNSLDKTAAVFRTQRFDDHGIFQFAHGKFLTASAKATSCLLYTGFMENKKPRCCHRGSFVSARCCTSGLRNPCRPCRRRPCRRRRACPSRACPWASRRSWLRW